MGAINSKLRNIKDCNYKSYSDLFNSGVSPVLEYGSSIWGFKQIRKCQNIQNKAMRHYLGVNKFSPNLMLEGDMGWIPMHIQIKINMLKLWNRICLLDPSRIPNMILKWELQNGINNWAFEINEILNSVNIFNDINHLTTINIETVKNKLLTIEENEWKTSVDNKPKLRTYSKFKTEVGIENYVTKCTNKYKRSLIAQFRSGTFPLQIEIGRYRNIQLNERTCKICNSNEIEDEFHVICICNVYQSFRDILYSEIEQKHNNFQNYNTENKFIEIMKNHPNELSKFLSNAIELRTAKLYN